VQLPSHFHLARDNQIVNLKRLLNEPQVDLDFQEK